MFSYILSFIFDATPQLDMLNSITTGILYISHGSSFFIYLAFNKCFRKVLFEYKHSN